MNDNAPYFLPENKTFGKLQAPPSPPTLYSARATFGQLPQILLRPQVCPWKGRKASSPASLSGIQQEERPEVSLCLCPNSHLTLGPAFLLWASVSPSAQWEVEDLLLAAQGWL